ncbi:MAG TPA: glycosyltransferase family 9 protein, partial [Phycicoccus sp.]|nr:glycosyltransferase family 9 protein [Phycicoccus sp.]
MTEVLALRALGLGDLLTGVPALRALRRAWPGARLTLAAPEPLGRWFTDLGVVDAVLPARGLEPPTNPSGRPPFDVAVNLHGSGPQSHRVLEALAPCRLIAFRCAEAGFADGPVWDDDEHEVARWLRLTASQGASGRPDDLRLDVPAAAARSGHVVVHPGAASRSRRWPAERWAEVARALGRAGHRVVVTGTADEAGDCATVASA